MNERSHACGDVAESPVAKREREIETLPRNPVPMCHSPTRRALLGCLAALAVILPRGVLKFGHPSDDDFVIVNGWVLKKSDLEATRS